MKELHATSPAGIPLQLYHFPVERVRAVIALVHGQGEHIGRYQHLARFFNQHHIAIVGIDLEGHGKSGGKRGHAASVDHLLDDIGVLLQHTQEVYPGVPTFLYGHSMGGGLCLNYVIRRQPTLQGLVVTGPWIRLAFEAPAIKVWAGRMLRKFMPALSLPTGLVANFISHDADVVNAYKNDPLVHAQMSAAAGIALLEAAEYLNQYAGKMPVPTLVQHGGDDKLTSAPASKEFCNRVGGKIWHKEWPGLYHEIHNEPSQQEVFQYTLDWMVERLSGC